MPAILIVEDEPFISDIYKIYFTKAHFDTVVAGNGIEALDKLKSFKPDIMLVDVMMPKMNGMEMLTYVKKDVKTKDIPIFMFSNITDQKEIDNCMANGATKFLIKSKYQPKQVVQMVKEQLGIA